MEESSEQSDILVQHPYTSLKKNSVEVENEFINLNSVERRSSNDHNQIKELNSVEDRRSSTYKNSSFLPTTLSSNIQKCNIKKTDFTNDIGMHNSEDFCYLVSAKKTPKQLLVISNQTLKNRKYNNNFEGINFNENCINKGKINLEKKQKQDNLIYNNKEKNLVSSGELMHNGQILKNTLHTNLNNRSLSFMAKKNNYSFGRNFFTNKINNYTINNSKSPKKSLNSTRNISNNQNKSGLKTYNLNLPLKRKELSKQTSPKINEIKNSFSLLKSENKMLKKFNKEFINALLKISLKRENVSFIECIQIMTLLGFIGLKNKSNVNNEKSLVYDMWNLLKKKYSGEVNKEKLKSFLLIILGLDKNQAILDKDLPKDYSKKSIKSKRENYLETSRNKNYISKDNKTDFSRSVNNSSFELSSKATIIREKFQKFYLNKLTFDRNIEIIDKHKNIGRNTNSFANWNRFVEGESTN